VARELYTRAFAGDPGDLQVLRQLITLYHNEPGALLEFIEKYLETCQTLPDGRESKGIFRARVDCVGHQGITGPQLVEALSDYVELLLLLGRAHDAKGAIDEFRGELSTAEYIEVLGIFDDYEEVADEVFGESVLTEYQNAGVTLITKLPDADMNLLRRVAVKLWVHSRRSFDELNSLYREQKRKMASEELLQDSLPTLELKGPSADLSGRRVVLVGGHSRMRARVEDILRDDGGLEELVVVEPSWERNRRQVDIDDCVRGADLVVVVTGCMKHSTSIMVDSALKRLGLQDCLLKPPGRGHTSVVGSIFEAAQARG